jgi:hypothetical protein
MCQQPFVTVTKELKTTNKITDKRRLYERNFEVVVSGFVGSKTMIYNRADQHSAIEGSIWSLDQLNSFSDSV